MDAKRELAKDVAAFANASGGYILIGIATKTSPMYPGEEIAEIRPLSQALFDTDQYRKILAEWLYPQPRNVEVRFVPVGGDANQGIGVVFVPPQQAEMKPYLITRTMGDKKSTEVLLGYVERRLDSTDVRSVMELHQLLRTGINLERELLGRIQHLELLVERHFGATAEAQTEKARAESLRNRIARSLDHPSLQNTPALVAYASPVQDAELRSIFSDRPDSIRRLLENPPSLRPHGWGLETGSAARLVEGTHLRVESFREVIDLYRDGCLVMAIAISRDSLAWSNKDDRTLHPLALIEMLTNFARFFQLVLADLRIAPERVTLGLTLQHLHFGDKNVRLPSGPLNTQWSYGGFGGAVEAPLDAWNKKITANTGSYSAERCAYELAREMYVWFGHTDDAVPYTKGDGDERVIDSEQIIRVG